MLKCKRIILLLFIIICIPLFIIGCRRIDVRSETIINDDESGQIDLYVKYDDMLADYIKGNIFNLDWAEENGYVVKKHTEGNNTVEELLYEFNNLEELENKMNSSGLINLSHTHKQKLNKKTYNFKLVVNKSNIEELLSKSIHTGDESKDKYVLNYLENIVIHNDIKYHDSKVRLNSATVKSKVDVLNCKLSQLEDGMNISFCIE